MSRRKAYLAVVALTGVAILAAVFAREDKPAGKLLLLEWAAKSKAAAPPSAVLIELGRKDAESTDWGGRAQVKGAKVVHREGYRFRDGDKLTEPDGWQAKSRTGVRVGPRQPAVRIQEGIGSVGVVLHLEGVARDATLTLDPPAEKKLDKAEVKLADVLAGKPQPVWGGAAVVRLVTTTSLLNDARTEDDFPAAAYGPDGTLWVAYISYTLKDESRRIDQKPYDAQPRDFKALSRPDFGDQLFVKYYRDGKWSQPIEITGAKEDLVRCAIAVDRDGDAWAIYSAHRDGKYDVHARPVSPKYSPEAKANPSPRPGPEIRVSGDYRPALSPAACTDSAGVIHVAFQAASTDPAHPFALGNASAVIKGGKVDELTWRGGRHGDYWHHAIAAGPDGRTATVFDGYHQGDYDVNLFEPGGAIALASSRFEARPSVCYDTKGRVWIAYEDGPTLWGKDYGALDDSDGNPLYNERNVRVVCVDKGKLFKPVADLPTVENPAPKLPFDGPKYERATRYSGPRIGIDGKGHVWLTYRVKFGSRYSTHAGSYWVTYARRLEGDKWGEPVEVCHSDGMLDHRPVLLPHAAGGLVVVHNGDNRYTDPQHLQHRVYHSYVDLSGEPAEPKLVAYDPGEKDDKLVKRQEAEAAAVKRMREHRVKAGGKEYRLLRGEFHRHTEISWDGGPDGSLEDMFRYGIDAAAFDWIGCGDHDNGAGREYTWWLTQKLTDAYHIKDRFTPMFTYERSVAYPHGHRNCVFVQRGVMTLPRLAEPDMDKRVGAVHADDTKMLYRYLHEHKGVCAAHTSATSMGTDWRDNDPVVEPMVEIYQGDRMSYEMEGAPRAGYEKDSGKQPLNVAGWYPKGFIDLALGKGYKLGFQASSDHWSTHISYCVVLAEKHDRQGIHDAMSKRHLYGATDDIVVDVTSGGHVMGDSFKATDPPKIKVFVSGTAPLEAVEVLRDSKVVATLKADGRECKAEWADPRPEGRSHYYYVRVQQKDKEIAWSSPMWVEYAK